ncbi:MAG TPA: conjugal transfer protein TraO [Paludibacteraceae bacterium]|nr:conjugal transfer protein TraO [Paludibacteraceae bacterium]
MKTLDSILDIETEFVDDRMIQVLNDIRIETNFKMNTIRVFNRNVLVKTFSSDVKINDFMSFLRRKTRGNFRRNKLVFVILRKILKNIEDKMRINLLLVFVLLFCFCGTQAQKVELVHVKGCQSIGVRYGMGTKNKYDVGLTYTYVFNQSTSFLVEIDHEEASFGYSDFVNDILVSPGIEYNVWNPTKWLYWHVDGGASLGYDSWSCDLVNDKTSGFVYGANVGTGLEFIPWAFLSFNLKAQQFLLFGNDDQYLKPNFSLGIKYNFHF